MNYIENLIEELDSYCFRNPLTVDDDIIVDSTEITVDSTEITVDQYIL